VEAVPADRGADTGAHGRQRWDQRYRSVWFDTGRRGSLHVCAAFPRRSRRSSPGRCDSAERSTLAPASRGRLCPAIPIACTTRCP
jgi:hypothetical protein